MRILIIEDDEKVAHFIQKGLEEEQYAVDVSHDGEDGAHWACENAYDLIILDLMLPKKDGYTICRELRGKKVHAPILMLTARDRLQDKVSGLDAGADDYLTKPFSFDELLARIRALLRRSQQYREEALRLGDLTLDPSSRTVNRGGRTVELTGKEYALLEYFMRNQGRVLTETQIIEHVWDMNFDSLANTVNVYIHHLRNKIDRGHEKKLLHTIRGMGFVLKE
ncbi:MAG: response regulator transcription factor [Spirochaetes bacterium]|nr:response regulator transcription factor [Spirochaetota bacterium]